MTDDTAPDNADDETTVEEVVEPEESADSTEKEGKRGLGIGVGLILALATVLALLAFVSLWADRQILNTDQWTDTSTQLLERPAVQHAVGDYAVNQLFNNVDVEGQLKENLPPELQGLAGPISGGLRQLATKGAYAALERPAVQQAWKTANKLAHQNALVILEGGNENVSTTNGAVTINTKLLLTNIANQVGLPQSLIAKLPPSVGQLTVIKSDKLKSAQNAVKLVKGMALWFSIAAVLLYAAAIGLAAGRRRIAVRWMGISLSLVGVLLLVGQSLGRTPLVDSLAATSAVVPAVTDVYNISTNLLKEMAISFFITGLLVVFASVLAGPAKFAVAFRREVAPFLRDYLPASTVAVVFLFLLLIWWAPTHGFRTTGGLIVNSLLAISGFIALVLMTRREFPDAVAPDFSHIDDWFRGHWDNAKGYVEDRTKREPKTEVISTTEVPAVKGEEKDLKLAQLKSLHEAGALNDAEFDAAVKRLSE